MRELCAGSTLYLPVFNHGALFSCGDGHAAQGDGEVCINGIECPLDVTLRFNLHKRQPLAGPIVEASDATAADSIADAWVVVETGTDLAADSARRHWPHDRPAGQPLGLQRDSRIPALQRGAQAAAQPGGQRAGAYGQRRIEQADPSGAGAVSNPMTINDPEVVAELRALYPLYEHALVTNDVEKLVEMFWAGPQVMRFGVTENLYGPGELEAFRKGRPAMNLARERQAARHCELRT